MSSFQTALSALKAASTAINTVGNNLANINTNGFKRSDVSFSELVSSVSENTPGAGVALPALNRQFNQGSVSGTNGALDAAIQGNGFFVVKPGTADSLEYTRDGQFKVSAAGQLVNGNGSRVQGWSADAAGVVSTTGAVGDISIPLGSVMAAVPTSSIEIAANLDAAAADATEFNIPLQLYDALGGGHQFTLKAIKDSANSWTLSLSSTDPLVEGGDDLSSTLSGTALNFVNGVLDPATESPITISGIAFTGDSGLPELGDITLELWKTPPSGDPPEGGISGFTQFSQPSAISRLSQNGSPAGTLANVRVGDGGTLMATYSNGLERQLGQIAMAVVQNPDSLLDVGGNSFRASTATSVLPPSEPGAGGGGTIVGQALESSNVDIAQEFTDLITYQRSYQASSRMITTVDQLMFETLNLKQ